MSTEDDEVANEVDGASCQHDAVLTALCAPEARGLIVLSAAAGYGKTWRLTETARVWTSRLPEKMAPRIWRLQASTTLFQAVRAFCTLFEHASMPAGPTLEAAVDAALSAVDSAPARAPLIIDLDGAPPSRAVLALVVQIVLEFAPRGFAVVACRSPRLLPLDRLGALVPLKVFCAKDLVFSINQIRRAQGIDHESAQDWFRCTEGWPVICAGVASWRNAHDDAQGQDTLCDHLVSLYADYFEHELLASLPGRDARLLMQVSVFDAIEPGMLEAMEVAAPWSRLSSLVESGLPLSGQPIDWDRIVLNPLFRRFLQRRLRLHAPALHHSLHRRAAHYFAADGSLRDAMRHAQQTGDPLLQAQITETHGGWRISFRAGLKALRPAYAGSAELAAQFPRAILARIYWQAQTGRVEEARHALEELDQQAVITPESDRLAIGAVVAIYRDEDFDERRVEELAQMRLAPSEAESLMAQLGGTVRAAILNNAGLHERAAQAARVSIVEAEALGGGYIEFYGQLQHALALHGLGRVGSVVPGYFRARDLALSAFGDNSGESRMIGLLLAHAAWLAGQDEMAFRTEDNLDGLYRLHAWVDPYGRVVQIASVLARERGGAALQDRVLEDFTDLALRRSLPRLRGLVELCRARQAFTDSDFDAALERCRSASEIMSESGLNHPHTLALVMGPLWLERARIALAKGLSDEVAESLESLRHWQMRTQDGTLALHSGLLQGYAALRARRYREASLHLTRCVRDAELSGLRRPFIEERTRVLELVQYARDHALKMEPGVLDRACEFALGGQRGPKDSPRHARPARGALLLTEREADILHFLAEGLSSKEMARRLAISETTVKTHRKHLYEKLETGLRSQAIMKARELGIL